MGARLVEGTAPGHGPADLLAHATPFEALAPLHVHGPPGAHTREAAQGLRAQLARLPKAPTPRPDGVRRGVPFRPADHDPALARALAGLMGAQPRDADAVVALFDGRPGLELEAFQAAALEAAFVGATVLAVAGLPADAGGDGRRDRLHDDLLRIAASATAAGSLVRDLLAQRGRRTGFEQPPIDGRDIPGLPGIPHDLLETAEELARRGCAAKAAGALRGWASAVASEMPRYLPNAITKLVPADCCPGEDLTIRGTRLGDGTRRAVVFTEQGGGVVVAPQGSIRSWDDGEIIVTVPAAAGKGPVGIVEFPAGGGATLAEAAGTALGELSACLGPAAIVRLEGTLGRMSVPPLAAPEEQEDGANLYLGGPPTVRSFVRQPGGALYPGQQVRLAWWIEDATDIEIVARSRPGSAAHELPPISGPLPHASGSVSVTVPGTRAWEAEYVLRAFNRCTGRTRPVERALPMSMPVRIGLALGGGGSRGDFQVGALRYLYDVKAVRPSAIAATSVGAVNAVDLVMGDDMNGSAAARLESNWRALNTESDMWTDMPWLASAKQQIRQVARSFSLEGLLAWPYTLVADGIAVGDLKSLLEDLRGRGATAFFTLAPTEARIRAAFDPAMAARAGIALRCVAVSVETGQIVEIDERGFHFDFAYPAAARPPTVAPAPPRDPVDGAIASSTMPGIFPARRIGDHTCVDGGVRDVVPVETAVRRLGCNVVYAIRLSAPPGPLVLDPARTFPAVMARSVLGLSYDEVADDDVDLDRFGPAVTIHSIRATVDLHDPLVVEPGLIRIAIDYGWMRAADALDVEPAQRATAMGLSDAITARRAQNWDLAHAAAAVIRPDRFRSFDAFLMQGALPASPSQLVPVPDADAVRAIRANCVAIRDLVRRRLQIGAPTLPPAVRTPWFTAWELTASPPLSADPFAEFVSVRETLPAAMPPAP